MSKITKKKASKGAKPQAAKPRNATSRSAAKSGEVKKAAKLSTSKGKAKAAGTKRVSALDAAAQVLAKSSKPMRAKELITAMAEQGLWTSPGGKTPWATLYSAITREITEKKGESRFKKMDRGTFAPRG